MGESLLTTLSMDNRHHPCTLLSMDTAGRACPPPNVSSLSPNNDGDADRDLTVPRQLAGPPDINLPLSAMRLPASSWHPDWHIEPCDLLDVGLGPHLYDAETILSQPKTGVARKGHKRGGDSIWGAWLFFSFYFKPVLSEKSKGKVTWDGSGVSGFDKSDLRTDVFLVQHDMENMYMWVFKERPDNALGKMQLRSYMNGHSRLGQPQFPFSVDKGFIRSHRMQRKQYRGLSNPQCIHGIEVVRLPNLSVVTEADCKKWIELTGRDLNFMIPPEASDFGAWRTIPSTEFELERPPPPPVLKNNLYSHPKKMINGSGLNLVTHPPNNCSSDGMDLSPVSSKRRKDFSPRVVDDDFCSPITSFPDRAHDVDIHPVEPAWLNEFSGVMRHAYGPVTASKTIYEDDEGYLIMMSLHFFDKQKVKVTWVNTLTHGIVKILCVSNARMSYIKRHDRTFKLTDPCPEHCPSGEFIREIPLATRIPEDAKLEAYYDETGTVLEIMVPKPRVGQEEHEVRVCMRPPHLRGGNELLLN